MCEDILRYKYLPIDENTLSVISNGTIKFSRSIEFNDPFDCSPEFDLPKTLSFLEKRKDLLKQAGDSLGYSPAKRIQNKSKMLKRVENVINRGKYGEEVAEKVGICCLSRNPLNLLMWAHYAKNHTGFVVEFSIPQSTISTIEEVDNYILKWLFPLKVNYSKEKPVINPYDSNDINMQKQFLTKGLDWGYEGEERVIDHIRGHGIHQYDRKRVLKSVIAGMKMSAEDLKKLKLAIDNTNIELKMNIQLYQVKAIKGEFALSVPERIDLVM